MKTFSFLGHDYETNRLASFVTVGGVQLKIKAEDLITQNSKLVTAPRSLPCVVHHESKYHALSLPKDFTPGQEVNVRMVTKPALKRLKLDV